jgi:Fe-S cluster biogenesis protein NfuA
MTTKSDQQAKKIAITAEISPDSDIGTFQVDHPITDGEEVVCRSRQQARGSALFEAIFAIAGVRETLVCGRTVTVVKSGTARWEDLAKLIGNAIRRAILSGDELITTNGTGSEVDNEDLTRRVNDVLEQQINNYVRSHGGRINVTEIRDGVVYVQLSGGCQGCSAASVTLRQGVERILKSSIPEVTQVVDVTDHSQGQHPYYS